MMVASRYWPFEWPTPGQVTVDGVTEQLFLPVDLTQCISRVFTHAQNTFNFDFSQNVKVVLRKKLTCTKNRLGNLLNNWNGLNWLYFGSTSTFIHHV